MSSLDQGFRFEIGMLLDRVSLGQLCWRPRAEVPCRFAVNPRALEGRLARRVNFVRPLTRERDVVLLPVRHPLWWGRLGGLQVKNSEQSASGNEKRREALRLEPRNHATIGRVHHLRHVSR